MAPVHSLDIYNSYNCDKAYHSDSVINQLELKTRYSDDYFDAVRNLIAAKVAKVHIFMNRFILKDEF